MGYEVDIRHGIGFQMGFSYFLYVGLLRVYIEF